MRNPSRSFDHDETEAGFVTHLAASTVDAQAITAPPISDSDEARSALDEAADFLTAYLAGGIEYRATEVQKAAQIERISDSTLARARLKAGVQSRRAGFGKGSTVWWSIAAIPVMDPSKSHTSQRPEAGTYGESWHLCDDEPDPTDLTDTRGRNSADD